MRAQSLTAPRSQPLRAAFRHLLYIAGALAAVGPVLWIVSLALKTRREFTAEPFGLPESLYLDNFTRVLSDSSMLRFAGNSVITTSISIVVVMIASTMAGYALARISFKGSTFLFVLFIMGDAIPLLVVLVPLFVLVHQLGLAGTRWSLILPYAAMNMGITTFLMRGFFRTISSDLEDAAQIDGCNLWQLLVFVLLPLVRPGLLVAAILNFISYWNEYFLAAILLPSQDLFTLPPGLAATFTGRFATDWPVMAAGIVLSLLPTLAVFVFAQDKIIEGWTMSVK